MFSSVNSRLRALGGETHIWGVNLIHFLTFFCILGVFLGGGNLGFWGEIPPPQEIAGNNTDVLQTAIYAMLLCLIV